MPLFKKSLAGPGYIILNVIRVMNIMSLLAVVAAASVMLVKTFIVSKFFFFDACGHVIEAWISIFLIVSELPLFRTWFINNWPMLGQHSGFVSLGVAMMVLGNSLLGYLNKAATSQKSLGLAFWRIVIGAGIVVIVMGVVNIFATYIFRDTAMGISARQVRSYGAVAPQKAESIAGSSRGSIKLSRKDSLPSYYSQPSPKSSTTETRSQPPRLPLTISRPIANNNEQFAKFSNSPEVTPPNLAHHPAMYSDRI